MKNISAKSTKRYYQVSWFHLNMLLRTTLMNKLTCKENIYGEVVENRANEDRKHDDEEYVTETGFVFRESMLNEFL